MTFRRRILSVLSVVTWAEVAVGLVGCPHAVDETRGSGGAPAAASGGAPGTGGSVGTGGAGTGGAATGGAATGGAATGGAATGGAGTGGAGTGGAGTGGAGTGGAGTGGAGTGGAGTGGLGMGGTAAAGGNAGQAGARGGTGGVGGSVPAACNNPNWKFCEDFEKYSVGTVPNGVFRPYAPNYNATIATTTDRKVSGTKSVKFHVSTTGRAFIDTDAPFPMPNNAFYGRMMIFLAQVPPGAVHWDIVSAYGRGGAEASGTGNYRWGGMFGHTMANHHPGDQALNVTTQRPQPGKWLCYEWMFDGPARRLEVWIDDYDKTGAGTTHGLLNAPTSWNAPNPFLTLQVGWAHYQTQQVGGDAWIDDLVVDEARIGCPDRASVP